MEVSRNYDRYESREKGGRDDNHTNTEIKAAVSERSISSLYYCVAIEP